VDADGRQTTVFASFAPNCNTSTTSSFRVPLQILTPGGFVPHVPPLRPRDVVRVEVDLWEGGGGTIAFAVNDGPRTGAAARITHNQGGGFVGLAGDRRLNR